MLKNRWSKKAFWAVIAVSVSATVFAQQSGNQGVELAVRPLIYGQETGSLYTDIYCTIDASTAGYERDETQQWAASLKIALQLEDKVDAIQFRYNSQDSAIGAPLLVQKSTFLWEDGWTAPELTVYVEDEVTGWSAQFSVELARPEGAFISPALVVEQVAEVSNASGAESAVSEVGVSPLYMKWGSVLVPKAAMEAVMIEENETELRWYAEAYVDTGAYVVQYKIKDESGRIVAGTGGYKRLEQGPNPVIVRVPTQAFEVGYYEIEVQLLNAKGERQEVLLTPIWIQPAGGAVEGQLPSDRMARVQFERFWGEWDQCVDYLGMIAPIVEFKDRRILMQLKEMQDTARIAAFLSNFWTDRSPENPATAWREYLLVVEEVNRAYGSRTLPGWKTHMGRVFLQYGAPSLVEERPFDGKN